MSIAPIAAAAAALLFATLATATEPDKYTDTDTRDPGVREAQAAQREAKDGRLTENADAEQRERNKVARCEVLPAEEREYCIRRMNGEGSVSGSVEGGGIYRELRVTVPAQ